MLEKQLKIAINEYNEMYNHAQQNNCSSLTQFSGMTSLENIVTEICNQKIQKIIRNSNGF